MTRWKAAAIHLSISVCVGPAAAALIFGVWYPPPYSHAVGADQLILLLLGVDVVLGPLLTLVVFKSGKKSLRFDLTVIALLQVCAFLYGMSVVVRARPAFIVGRVDRFVIVSANDLDDEDFAKASDPQFRSAPWTGPKVIGAAVPTDTQLRNDVLFSSAGGKDLEKFPQYYTDYDAVAADAAQIRQAFGRSRAEKAGSDQRDRRHPVAKEIARRGCRVDSAGCAPREHDDAARSLVRPAAAGHRDRSLVEPLAPARPTAPCQDLTVPVRFNAHFQSICAKRL